ncbi:MAG TPA: GNAT family N-acetyltransferase [Candidatus Dormibacteraeota bacterium]|nr:GNAT family N-acetyltransferase [Candidatus Dormibacteraeota bacterium]
MSGLPDDVEAVLETPRLRLEPLRERDAEELYPYLRDPRIYAYLTEGPPATVEDLRARYRRWECRWSPDGRRLWLNWVVRLAENAQPVGAFQATVPSEGPALIGYVFFPAFWGAGYAREAAARIMHLLFEAYGLRRVEAFVDVRNERSIALLSALGFRRAATVRAGEGEEHRFELRADRAAQLQSAERRA